MAVDSPATLFHCIVSGRYQIRIRRRKVGPGCQPRLPTILSTYGRKRFSHIEVGVGSGVPRLTRMPGRNEHA